MNRLGSLNDWRMYLGARNDDDASAALAAHLNRIDAAYDVLAPEVLDLWGSPTGEVADVLMVARTAIADARGMLEGVQARFRSGERGIA